MTDASRPPAPSPRLPLRRLPRARRERSYEATLTQMARAMLRNAADRDVTPRAGRNAA